MKILLLFALAAPLAAQDAVTLAARTATVLQREYSGHSPTDEDINTAGNITPAPTADQVCQALPNLIKLLASTDGPARTYALSLLIGLQSSTDRLQANAVPASTDTSPVATPVVSSFSAETSKILAQAIPQIAAHLTDEVIPNPSLTATVLGGFTSNTPPAVFPPLYAYLQRDDAIAGVGLEVIQDLLGYGPLSMNSAVAIGRYLRRRDQTSSSRANLVDAISSSPNQSQPLNKTLLEYLNSDDDSLRARLILSLPQLDLALDVFTDVKARIASLVENRNENLQVISAAKAVTPCWSVPHITGCPNYTP